MRSEGHSELHMGSGQTGAVVNGLLDDGDARSFPRQPVWLAAVLHWPLPNPLATIECDRRKRPSEAALKMLGRQVLCEFER